MTVARKVCLGSALVALVLATGCSRMMRRTYQAPLPDVYLASQEACTAVGYKLVSEDGKAHLGGERKTLWGFLAGQGGERIRINLQPSGQATDATVHSEKQSVGFLVQIHRHERVARYIQEYLDENAKLKKAVAK